MPDQLTITQLLNVDPTDMEAEDVLRLQMAVRAAQLRIQTVQMAKNDDAWQIAMDDLVGLVEKWAGAVPPPPSPPPPRFRIT